MYSIIKKIPAIPPLLVDGKFVSDFCEKANLFNNFFSSICTPIQNTSILPPFLHRTNARITSFYVTKEDILLIIKNLDSSKAHGWDNISIKMIKICGESITVPLKIIFEQSLKENKFPEVWKKANIVPVHKKEDKNLIKNYAQSVYFQSLVKFMKELSTMPSSIILKTINFLHLLNQVSCQATHV